MVLAYVCFLPDNINYSKINFSKNLLYTKSNIWNERIYGRFYACNFSMACPLWFIYFFPFYKWSINFTWVIKQLFNFDLFWVVCISDGEIIQKICLLFVCKRVSKASQRTVVSNPPLWLIPRESSFCYSVKLLGWQAFRNRDLQWWGGERSEREEAEER